MIAASDLVDVVPENSVRFLGHETHAHEVPHLIHVVMGSAALVVDGHPIRLGLHETLWLAAGVPHSARYSEGSIVLGPFLSAETVPPVPVYRLGVVPALTRIFTTVLGASPGTDEQIRPFRRALDDVLRAMTAAPFPAPLPQHPAARAVGRDALTALTLGELAARHGTSVRHIQRIFLEETGLSFSRWRTRTRLNIAVARLRGGDGLLVAAHIAGYATRSGLLKALSRETGVPDHRLAADPLAGVADALRAAAKRTGAGAQG